MSRRRHAYTWTDCLVYVLFLIAYKWATISIALKSMLGYLP